MKKYMRCLFSFLLGAVCIFIGLTMTATSKNQFIIYFLYLVGIVNIYIGTKDLIAGFKNTK
jgi:hypothetical protein